MKQLLSVLESKYPLTEPKFTADNQLFVTIEKKFLTDLILYLKNYHDFSHLSFLTAVDHFPEKQFQLTYMLHCYSQNQDIGIRVFLDREHAQMESIHPIWKTAATYQRELYEMFGIEFVDSPNLNEPFILEGWTEIPPMRKDFDTKLYSEKTYFPRSGRKTYDPKKYMKEKLYPAFPEENQ